MPWSVRSTGDEWCVYKEGESKPVGCHASRNKAVAQQRALYANEAKTASAVQNGGNVTFQVEAPREYEEALVATLKQLTQQMDAVTLRVQRDEEIMERILTLVAGVNDREDRDYTELRSALTAALEQPAPEPPVVNVTVPEPVVTVNVPEARVEVTTPQPVVNVTIPPAKREIKFERDPMSGQITNAEVVELDG